MKKCGVCKSILILIGIVLCFSFESVTANGQQNAFVDVSSWVYVLQDAQIEHILFAHPSIAVMDYSYDGSDGGAYSRQQIIKLRENGIVPIAYISIGEAEDYRWYWDESWYNSPPSWLGRENPHWPGDYAVKFWYPEWQSIVFRYVDKVISQGFQGVYLDKVDIYEYWADEDNGEDIYLPESTTASLMIDFIKKISQYGHKKVFPFYVFIQNGETLVDYDDGRLISHIDGIGIEALFYEGNKVNPPTYIQKRIKYLEFFKDAGKVVMVVEYVDCGKDMDNLKRIQDAIRKNLYHGYIPYIAKCDYELRGVNIIPTLQPFVYPGNGISYSGYR